MVVVVAAIVWFGLLYPHVNISISLVCLSKSSRYLFVGVVLMPVDHLDHVSQLLGNAVKLRHLVDAYNVNND